MVPGEPSRAASGRGLTASMLPPIASTMPRAIARPEPGAGRHTVAAAGAVEAVEHVRQVGGGNAHALVGDGQWRRGLAAAWPLTRTNEPAGA